MAVIHVRLKRLKNTGTVFLRIFKGSLLIFLLTEKLDVFKGSLFSKNRYATL